MPPFRLLCSVLLALTCAAPAAQAAPPAASCQLLKDGPGDVAPVADDQLDIRSADVAGDRRTLAVAIRLTALADVDPASPIGRVYDVAIDFGPGTPLVGFNATLGATSYDYSAQRYSGVPTESFTSTQLAVARGQVDLAKKEIRIWADYNAFASAVELKAGRKARRAWVATARTGTVRPAPMALVSADGANTTKSYALGARSCLPVGR